MDKNGVARSTWAYDARGNVTEEAYFGLDGKPVLHKSGVARWTKAYDARGNLIEAASFGIDGRPLPNDFGCSIMRWTFNKRDLKTSYACFDTKSVQLMYYLLQLFFITFLATFF